MLGYRSFDIEQEFGRFQFGNIRPEVVWCKCFTHHNALSQRAHHQRDVIALYLGIDAVAAETANVHPSKDNRHGKGKARQGTSEKAGHRSAAQA